jgi:ATPase family protein associated with various cellular activities (AAA)
VAGEIKQEKARKLKATPESVGEAFRVAVEELGSWDKVIEHATRAKERDEQPIEFYETIRAFPLDAALALYKAIERKFGVALLEGQTIQTFFGKMKQDVAMIAVQTGPEESDKVLVPWGDFPLPGGAGVLSIRANVRDGVQVLDVKAATKRKFEDVVRATVELAREIVTKESLYRSKALRMVFRSDFFKGQFADVRFMDLRGVQRSDLIFSKGLQAAIDTNIWTPLRYPQACTIVGVPQKRGVVLAGPFGVGKTMLAQVTAQIATECGYTFVYLEEVERLPDALTFAQQYAPAVLFAEDIDRVANTRDEVLNTILNSLDGIESKNYRVMTILSTNNVEQIHPALLRPGRTDVLLNIQAPDAEAVERLLRKYARGRIAESVNLDQVSTKLSGQIPATVREVVERSKLAAIGRTLGDAEAQLVEVDLEEAAFTVLQQRELVEGKHDDSIKPATELERAFAILGHSIEKSAPLARPQPEVAA